MEEEDTRVVVPEDEEKQLIFDTVLAQNGQATIKKEIRERLNLEPGFRLYLKVLKVISPDGKTTYESLEITQQ